MIKLWQIKRRVARKLGYNSSAIASIISACILGFYIVIVALRNFNAVVSTIVIMLGLVVSFVVAIAMDVWFTVFKDKHNHTVNNAITISDSICWIRLERLSIYSDATYSSYYFFTSRLYRELHSNKNAYHKVVMF